LDAARGELLVGALDIVARQRAVERAAGLQPVLAEIEQHDARVGRPDAQLDPALRVVERLVGEHAEAERFGPELDGAVLIARGDADELHMRNHAESRPQLRRAHNGLLYYCSYRYYSRDEAGSSRRLRARNADAGPRPARSPALGVSRISPSVAPV